MDETLAQLIINTMTTNTATKTVSVKAGNQSSIYCFLNNKTVHITGYKVGTFLLLREDEQYLLGKKLNTFSRHEVSDLVLSLVTYLHDDGLKTPVIRVLKMLFRMRQ